MRAVIIGTDFVRDTDGSFKAIETNTNIHPAVSMKYYFDVNVLDTITSGSTINEIYFINKRNLLNSLQSEVDVTVWDSGSIDDSIGVNLQTALQYYCETRGIIYNSVLVDNNSITIPHIEDTPNKLIIRISYDTTALIDDVYARDNWEFLKLMHDSNPTSIPKTYINDIELGFDSIGTTLRDNGIHPNYCIKKRVTPSDNHTWPTLYKINSIEELNNLKSNLAPDEYIQEYVINETDLLDGRLTHYRSVDLLYGSNLDVLNLWSVQFSNTFELDPVCDYEDTNKVPYWERPKYIYKYSNNERAPKLSADASTKVFLPDTGLTLLSSLSINDRVKSITIPELPMNETSYNIKEWSGSYTNLMENFEVSSSALTDMYNTSEWVGFLINIECSGGVVFSDVSNALILRKELESGSENNHIIKFVEYGDLDVNDTLILFDSETNSLIERQIQNMTITYDKVSVYTVNFEQLDLFLTSEEDGSRYGLLTHNYTYSCVTISAPCIGCYECSGPIGGQAFVFDTNLRCCRCGGVGYPACFGGYSQPSACQQGHCCSTGPGNCNPGPPTQGPLASTFTCTTGTFCNTQKGG